MRHQPFLAHALRFALACILATLTLSCRPPQSQEQVVRVGVILPLTGEAAVYGKAIRNGIEIAQGEEGNSPIKVSLVYEDDQGQAAQAVSAARRLIDVEKVPAIIGGAMSSTAEASIPICDASKVVLLSPTATKPSLPHQGGYFLRLWPSDDYDGKVMAETAYNQLGLRKIGILYINIAYGTGITEVFEREFIKLGGVVVAKEGYNQGVTDFRTALTKIQSSNPEAIYLPGYVAEITQILKQAKELGIKTRFLGVNSLYDPKLIEIAGEAAEGAVFTYPTFDTKSTDPAIERFVNAYRAKYGSDPDAFAAQGYDSYRVLKKALDQLQGKTFEGTSILKSLHSIGQFQGPGGTFTFDEKGDVEKPLRLLTVRDGQFVPMQQ
jgi:branched-chain amino acid transport system substrate-binding protein